ncbi:hypothetical protein HMPREF1373_01942 [Enterococcus faecium P1140]|nr:hypothetical protein HMPREF1373_01942 [Enterococcus faecium P1140]
MTDKNSCLQVGDSCSLCVRRINQYYFSFSAMLHLNDKTKNSSD